MIVGRLCLLLVLVTAVVGTDENKGKFPSRLAAAVGLSFEDYNAMNLEARDSKSEYNSDLFEGDILNSRSELRKLLGKRSGRNAIAFMPTWRYGVVPYVIDQNVPDERRKKIKLEIQQLLEKVNARGRCLCIRPYNQSIDEKYVHVKWKDGECSSMIGPQYLNTTSRGQLLYLGDGCYKGSVHHEFLHALGFWHEQSRDDRDDYVTIIEENIKPWALEQGNFAKHKTWNQGLPYDYGSIMHYQAKGFSKNGKATIVAKGGQKFGQREGVSDQDVEEVRRLYRCKSEDSAKFEEWLARNGLC